MSNPLQNVFLCFASGMRIYWYLGFFDYFMENNINIHATLSSIQTIITSQKETYINEIKDIIDHKYLDSNEKIQAIISKSDESLLDKTKLFLRQKLA